jgi:hypothetical protein
MQKNLSFVCVSSCLSGRNCRGEFAVTPSELHYICHGTSHLTSATQLRFPFQKNFITICCEEPRSYEISSTLTHLMRLLITRALNLRISLSSLQNQMQSVHKLSQLFQAPGFVRESEWVSDDPGAYRISLGEIARAGGKFIHELQILIDRDFWRRKVVIFCLLFTFAAHLCFGLCAQRGWRAKRSKRASSAHLQFKVCHRFTPAPECCLLKCSIRVF